MILFDASYINIGGGKILLDLLICEFKKVNLNVYFLLDKRIENEYKYLSGRATFISSSIIERHKFYLNNQFSFSVVFSFCNLPPTLRLECLVFTYFQNVLLLDKYKSFNSFLKWFYLKLFMKNTDYWLVQSKVVSDLLKKNLYKNINVAVCPIFEERNILKKAFRTIDIKNIKFLYVSSGELHKNHHRLLEAFKLYCEKYPLSSLSLTVGNEYSSTCKLIEDYKERFNINIINHGYVSKFELEKIYENNDVFIFPSLKESFGLGLIEAAQFCMPILVSDMEYSSEVIIASGKFDPYNVNDILCRMLNHNSYLNIIPTIISKNNVNSIIQILQKN